MSKAQLAVKMKKRRPDMTQTAIAKKLGIAPRTVGRALQRARETDGKRCKACGHLLPYLKDVIAKT